MYSVGFASILTLLMLGSAEAADCRAQATTYAAQPTDENIETLASCLDPIRKKRPVKWEAFKFPPSGPNGSKFAPPRDKMQGIRDQRG